MLSSSSCTHQLKPPCMHQLDPKVLIHSLILLLPPTSSRVQQHQERKSNNHAGLHYILLSFFPFSVFLVFFTPFCFARDRLLPFNSARFCQSPYLQTNYDIPNFPSWFFPSHTQSCMYNINIKFKNLKPTHINETHKPQWCHEPQPETSCSHQLRCSQFAASGQCSSRGTSVSCTQATHYASIYSWTHMHSIIHSLSRTFIHYCDFVF